MSLRRSNITLNMYHSTTTLIYRSTTTLPTTVTIITKGDKDPKLLSNWRPLTLLNTFYKLISRMLAERLKPVLERIVGHEQ